MSAVSDRGYKAAKSHGYMPGVVDCGYHLPQGNENCIKGGDLDRSLNVPP